MHRLERKLREGQRDTISDLHSDDGLPCGLAGGAEAAAQGELRAFNPNGATINRRVW